MEMICSRVVFNVFDATYKGCFNDGLQYLNAIAYSYELEVVMSLAI